MLNRAHLTQYVLFDVLQFITLKRIQIHLKIWVTTEIAFVVHSLKMATVMIWWL